MSFERVRPGGAGRKRRRPGRGRPNPRGRPGEAAGKQATLGRLEYSPETVHQTDRYHQITAKADRIGELFAEDLEKPEAPIVLDLDATHKPTARRLGGEVFPRIRRLVLLPLCIFCREEHLCAKLRRSNIDLSEGTLPKLKRIVEAIRQRWPETETILRADSGFARERIMKGSEDNDVDYVFGLAKNSRQGPRRGADGPGGAKS